MDLFNIFNEYRNGNTTVIDELFTFEDGFKHRGSRSSYSEADIIVNDPILNALAEKIYRHYKSKAKFTKKKNGISKFSETPYLGTANDVKMEMFVVLRELFDDMNFNPQNSKEIGEVVKYRLQRRLGKIIGKSAFAFSENIVNDDGEKVSLLDVVESYGLLPCESPFIGDELDKDDFKHRYEITEILNVLEKHDIKILIQNNAVAQINFVDFLRENYHLIYDVKEQSMRYPAEKELLGKYCNEYGNVSQQRFSAMLRQLFDLLCSCTTIINNHVVTREAYLNDSYYDGKMNFVSLSSEKTNKMLKLRNKLADYVPCTIKDDTYFDIIAEVDVMEICRKNRTLLKAIKGRNNLTLEEYSDVLTAVSFMINDYCNEKVTYQFERFFNDHTEYSYDFDVNKIHDLCMGVLPVNRYWRMIKTDNGFSLRIFKKCDDGYFTSFTGRNSRVDFTDIKCVQIGLFKFFVSDTNKMIYCCFVLRELSFTRRVGNKNFGLLAS